MKTIINAKIIFESDKLQQHWRNGDKEVFSVFKLVGILNRGDFEFLEASRDIYTNNSSDDEVILVIRQK